jgi:hypothetical protein
MAADDCLPRAIQVILDRTGPGSFFICESGGLRKWIDPGLFLMMIRNNAGKEVTLRFSLYDGYPVHFDDGLPDFDIHRITIEGDSWKIIDQP